MVKKILKVLGALLGCVAMFILVVYIMVVVGTPGQEKFSEYSMPDDVVLLDQNWTKDIRQQFHFTTFGSRLVPYSWFLNLQLPGSKQLLRDNVHMERLGFILQKPGANNPDGIPVGFAVDEDETGEAWVGLTCAMCHTGQVAYQGQKIMVEGGPTMMNYAGFLDSLTDSLNSTLTNEDVFEQFSKSVDAKYKEQLRESLTERAKFFNTLKGMNATEVPYGHGRVDAFGQIFNAISAYALEIPENAKSPDAPVSIPVLWDAPYMDLVQWNASAPNIEPGPLGQNAVTALAVFGQIKMEKEGLGYESTVEIKNLGYIQSQLNKLQPPQWPEEILGAIDQQKAGKGKVHYDRHCASCHEVVSRDRKDKRLKAGIIPLAEIGTDAVAAKNFATAKSKTGRLEGEKLAMIAGPKFTDEAATIDLLINAVVGLLLKHPVDTLTTMRMEYRSVYSAPTDFTREVYKARPLDGIWSAAPYLHNGSVPTVYDLLLPADQRPSSFYVGTRELDIVKVGNLQDKEEQGTLFDTSLYGNTNTGHEFGTSLSDEERWELVEYIKTL